MLLRLVYDCRRSISCQHRRPPIPFITLQIIQSVVQPSTFLSQQSAIDEILRQVRLRQSQQASGQAEQDHQRQRPGVRPQENLHAQEVAPLSNGLLRGAHLVAIVIRFVVVSRFRKMSFFDSSVSASQISSDEPAP